MTRVEEGRRKRAYRPKTRTGCATCKRRHVKCDETRPRCIQCTSQGRRCEYYAIEPLNHHDTIRMEINTTDTISESRAEKRAFAYFRQRTSMHLAGLLENEIWSYTVLQLSRSDASIRHALVALAAVHEDFEQTAAGPLPTSQFALLQYNRAIRLHVERSKSTQPMTARHSMSYLISCALFICIEMLQGHISSAVSLIKQAVGLLYTLPSESIARVSSVSSMEPFEALFCRLQSMAIGVVGRAAYSGTVPPRIKASTISAMPNRFSSVRQAKEYLDFYLQRHELSRRPSSLGYINDPNEKDEEARTAAATYSALIVRWCHAFHAWQLGCEQNGAIDPRDRRAAMILDIRMRFLTYLAGYPTWDNCRAMFNEILDLVELVLRDLTSAEPFTGSKVERLFTLEVGTVSPLFMIARGCRDPVVRRRAIRILREFPIREGLWDSSMAADIAEHVMQLEEAASGGNVESAQDIPLRVRIGEFEIQESSPVSGPETPSTGVTSLPG